MDHIPFSFDIWPHDLMSFLPNIVHGLVRHFLEALSVNRQLTTHRKPCKLHGCIALIWIIHLQINISLDTYRTCPQLYCTLKRGDEQSKFIMMQIFFFGEFYKVTFPSIQLGVLNCKFCKFLNSTINPPLLKIETAQIPGLSTWRKRRFRMGWFV